MGISKIFCTLNTSKVLIFIAFQLQGLDVQSFLKTILPSYVSIKNGIYFINPEQKNHLILCLYVISHSAVSTPFSHVSPYLVLNSPCFLLASQDLSPTTLNTKGINLFFRVCTSSLRDQNFNRKLR